jgi:rubredoxin---NAD+ reductase
MTDPVVIVGAGLAGYNFARELRKLDAAVPLVVISQDAAGFYSKPMLSNALAGNKTAQTLVMKDADKMSAELNARLLPFTTVVSVDAAARQLTLSSGETLAYRDLVLALGADTIRLPLAGDAADTVLSVNDLDGFDRFSKALADAPSGQPAQRVAILGAGLIGCEFANDLLARQIKPVVLDMADRLLPRLLPPVASAALQAKLEDGGASFKFNVAAQAVNRGASGLQVVLNNGEVVEADLVLSAVGLSPRTALAKAAGAQVSRGVVVNRHLQTSLPHVHALGDCAEVDGWVLPYVMPLMAQARALAATLAGQPTAVAYPAMPVVVKTPAWPTVVCPPAPGGDGQWQVEVLEDGLVARCVSASQPEQLLGFALQGKAVSQRQALATQVPAWLV